jgi:hypothetical protein
MSNMVLYYITFKLKSYNYDSPNSPPNFLHSFEAWKLN